MESESAEERRPVLPWMRNPVLIDKECAPRRVLSLPSIDKRLGKALHKMGITSLFPVQVAVWRQIFGSYHCERDLCICTPTGSGKTLAYAFPIVQKLCQHKFKRLRALVVLPTRDLAIQVKDIFDALAPAVGLSVGLVVGQSSLADEISQLIVKDTLDPDIFYSFDDAPWEYRSAVDILVATPGRLMEHINCTKGFTLEHLRYLVVDEADRLLREAYQSWLPNVLKSACSHNEVRFPLNEPHPRLVKMMLSATLTQDPSKLVQLDLHHPLLLKGGEKLRYQLPGRLKSYKVTCESKFKPLYLLALLKTLQGEKCIVITQSVESTHRLCMLLNFFGDLPVKIDEYSRLQRNQPTRSKTLRAFREGETQVLICSDAITRGMDIEGVKNVINYDMPNNVKKYIHRAGRTARAGHAGCCFTLLRKDQIKPFGKILQKVSNPSCPNYTVPSEFVESYRAMYPTALEKLKESVDSKTHRNHMVNNKHQGTGLTKKSQPA